MRALLFRSTLAFIKSSWLITIPPFLGGRIQRIYFV